MPKFDTKRIFLVPNFGNGYSRLRTTIGLALHCWICQKIFTGQSPAVSAISPLEMGTSINSYYYKLIITSLPNTETNSEHNHRKTEEKFLIDIDILIPQHICVGTFQEPRISLPFFSILLYRYICTWKHLVPTHLNSPCYSYRNHTKWSPDYVNYTKAPLYSCER